jgi:hypothetical protein
MHLFSFGKRDRKVEGENVPAERENGKFEGKT